MVKQRLHIGIVIISLCVAFYFFVLSSSCISNSNIEINESAIELQINNVDKYTVDDTGRDAESDSSDIVTDTDSRIVPNYEDVSKGDILFSDERIKALSIDGGYKKIESTQGDVVKIFQWLKEELKEQDVILLGDYPVAVYMQVVSGYKYRILSIYKLEVGDEERLLLAKVFHRSDGLKEIQGIILNIEE